MAPKAWTAEADLDAIFATVFQNVPNAPMGGINWERAHQIMTGLGYKFSKDAISQRWSKVINKNAKQRVNQGIRNVANGNVAPATPTSARGKRSRPAPSSGARANQATAQMARAARAADDGGDDSEEDLDVKRPAKRQVPVGGLAAGLNGQKIDLTNDNNHDDEVQFVQNVDQTPVKTEIKDGEDKKTIISTLAPSVAHTFVKVKKQEDPSDSDAQGYLDGEV
ncbi:hypothetical protein GCG54_00002254 [Colletotrichum gloeosporioides]|uniref:Uncharacterized protein n=1 Tax=Colletotrichum gloeosporioides TaxID=474922 RepID=A0A8H4C972_COLGL|nr:uncharacterized protein GCG54_00002254 [Colletotrichum gloeosporioides]KAF3799552.1 hypothetical protein GCG54_00002254 [Colletotrichum gloeosporioides]